MASDVHTSALVLLRVQTRKSHSQAIKSVPRTENSLPLFLSLTFTQHHAVYTQEDFATHDSPINQQKNNHDIHSSHIRWSDPLSVVLVVLDKCRLR